MACPASQPNWSKGEEGAFGTLMSWLVPGRRRAAATCLLPLLKQDLDSSVCWHFVQIMKSDEDVRMISAEAPVLFAKVR